MKDLFDKILVFDLDDTIIDTRGIKIILFGIANELGIRDEATLEIYKRARDNGFTLEKFAQELSEATGQGGDEIKRRMEQAILERRAELFFPDAKDFLSRGREHKTEMRLLTFGADSWQKEKVILFGLDEFFHSIIPTEDEREGKLEELSAIVGSGNGVGVMLFNDKLSEIKAALARFPGLSAGWRSAKATEELVGMDEEMRRRIKVFSDFSELVESKNRIGTVILAAGKGTRMKSDKLKVMHELRGRPLVDYVARAVEKLGWPERPVVVVCGEDDSVQKYLGPRVNYVVQENQLGTGQAVAVTENVLRDKVDHVVVLYGDMPFITGASIERLVGQHLENNDVLTLMTTEVMNFDEWRKNLFEYGRIIRGKSGEIIEIIEKKDATPEQLKIKEVNPGYFCFQAGWLWENLKRLKNNNAQEEYYLTDLVKLAFEQKVNMSSVEIEPKEAVGINTLENLQIANQIFSYEN